MNAETTPRRCPLWIKIALALSLALNLAIAGLVAGFVLRGGPLAGRGPSMGYAMPYVLALPREDRREVFRTLRNDKDLPDRRARRAAYSEMIAALQATPFEVSAVEAVLARQGEGASRVQAVAQAAWLEAVSGFSDEERLAYTARMQEALDRRKPRKK
ncbi:periplasmic heavy metal sensor [uncultured Tateyamaria sp.]|uniref:periplasmic heavy metal sensor n=1 Tax=uncultured Tateyamaria sp. TaxID=455651 RepID=UPI00261E7BD4|nr:periplasmic heavy metal sensor [uncultured Tateyamaria sp.]